jgi:hypothetical protein
MKNQIEDIPFEDQNINIRTSANKNARRGFFIMLSGPALLLIWTGIFAIAIGTGTSPGGDVFFYLALIIAAIAFFLPLTGLIFAIKSLWHKDELDGVGRALAIITCVMCNPLFYFFYFFVCISGGFGLAFGFSM